jgi:hypothetical protein
MPDITIILLFVVVVVGCGWRVRVGKQELNSSETSCDMVEK